MHLYGRNPRCFSEKTVAEITIGGVKGYNERMDEMKFWEEYDRKTTFLEEFRESRRMPEKEQWEAIYQCTKDSVSDIRCDAAEVLGIRCNEQDEGRLRQMTYDKDMMVNVTAVEALEEGCQEKTLKRLYELMRTGGRMLRGYAVDSFLCVWINRYGYTKSSVKKCWRKMEKLYKKEEADWVRVFYEKARYLCGNREGLTGIERILSTAQESYHICNHQSMAFSQFKNLRTVFNEQEINHRIEESLVYVKDSWGVKKSMREFIEEKEKPGVLFVDRKNEALSQMLDYLSTEMEDEMWRESAGLYPAEMIRNEVVEKLQEEERMKQYYYPKKIRSVWVYDFIVPIGIRLKPEDYPFQRIVPLFEDVDENMLNVEQAKRMLEELRDYIYVEMHHEE